MRHVHKSSSTVIYCNSWLGGYRPRIEPRGLAWRIQASYWTPWRGFAPTFSVQTLRAFIPVLLDSHRLSASDLSVCAAPIVIRAVTACGRYLRSTLRTVIPFMIFICA